jgi:hypothetical protein
VLEATGWGVRAARDQTSGWFALGPLARGELFLASPLFIEAEVAAMAHVTKDRFYFLPDTTAAFESPLLGAYASVGVGVLFL